MNENYFTVRIYQPLANEIKAAHAKFIGQSGTAIDRNTFVIRMIESGLEREKYVRKSEENP